jgi:hypothetical protein
MAMRASIFFAAVGQALPFILDGRVIRPRGNQQGALARIAERAHCRRAGNARLQLRSVVRDRRARQKRPKPSSTCSPPRCGRALGLADVKSTLETMGSIGRPTTPEEAQAYVLKEYENAWKAHHDR